MGGWGGKRGEEGGGVMLLTLEEVPLAVLPLPGRWGQVSMQQVALLR